MAQVEWKKKNQYRFQFVILQSAANYGYLCFFLSLLRFSFHNFQFPYSYPYGSKFKDVIKVHTGDFNVYLIYILYLFFGNLFILVLGANCKKIEINH